MNLLYDYAMRLVGTPYRWGGDDPMAGFDCSGLAIELLVATGKLPPNTDMTAQGLFNMFVKGGLGMCTQPYLGCLAFYGKGQDKVIHVATCLNNTSMIEAGGGGSSTLTNADAIKQNAFVRVRPIHYRKDFVACLMT